MTSVTFSIEFMQFGMQKEHYKGNHKAPDPDNTFVLVDTNYWLSVYFNILQYKTDTITLDVYLNIYNGKNSNKS